MSEIKDNLEYTILSIKVKIIMFSCFQRPVIFVFYGCSLRISEHWTIPKDGKYHLYTLKDT